MTKYDVIFESIQEQLNNEEITLEQAEELNELAYEKYSDEEVEITYDEYLEALEYALFDIEDDMFIESEVSEMIKEVKDVAQLKAVARDIDKTIASLSKKTFGNRVAAERDLRAVRAKMVKGMKLSKGTNLYDELETAVKKIDDEIHQLHKKNNKTAAIAAGIGIGAGAAGVGVAIAGKTLANRIQSSPDFWEKREEIASKLAAKKSLVNRKFGETKQKIDDAKHRNITKKDIKAALKSAEKNV